MSFTLPNSGFHLPFNQGKKIADLFAPDADLEHALKFEKSLAIAQGKLGLIPEEHAATIIRHLASFKPDIPALETGIKNDGLYVPALVKQIRTELPEGVRESFHKDTTSQDVIDTSLMLRMKTAVEWIAQDCVEVLSGLQQLKDEIGNRELSARTRMQAALPFTLADRIEGWQEPIKSLYGDKPDYFPLQLGGPIGMMHKREPQWKDLVRLLAEDLELAPIARPWHTDRQPLVNLCSWMVALSTALGKMGQDITLMVQNGIDELGLKGGGSSSAMPHKNNPVLAETLVAIAQYNAGQMGLVHTAALHEQERSGISWTLEFMTIPQIVLACAGSVQIARKLITQLR